MSITRDATPALRILVALFALALIGTLAYLVVENQQVLTAIGSDQEYQAE